MVGHNPADRRYEVHRLTERLAAFAAHPQREGAPSPASVQNSIACGSQKQPRTTPVMPRSLTRRNRAVLSDGAPATRVVGGSGGYHGALARFKGSVERGVDAFEPGASVFAHVPRLTGEHSGQGLGPGSVAIGDDQDFRSDILDIGPWKAVAEGDRKDAVLAFKRF